VSGPVSGVPLVDSQSHDLVLCVAGDRAEGAEAALHAGLNKLTSTAAQKQKDEDEQDLRVGSATLLLNGVS